jgi:ClpA/ClpB-like protein
MTWEPVGVFERFTERARRVVVLAQEESRALGNDHVGTEHILLGLLGEEEGLASRVLESLQVTLEDVRKQVVRTAGSDEPVRLEHIPFTPGARKVLVRALDEALSLGQNSVGTEHILLGLLRKDEGVGVPILLELGASAEMVRGLVLESLSAGPVRLRAASAQTTGGSIDARPAAIDPVSRGRTFCRLPESLASLSLADQFVLLTLECSRGRVRRALKIAGLPPLREITGDLKRRQLVRARPLHRPEPEPDAPLDALRKRLGATVWSVERPEGAAAELLLLVAFAGALDGVSAAAHLNARHRISSLGDRRATPPPLLAKMLEEARVDSARELATKLLPGRVVVRAGELDPGVNAAVSGAGHGGGTLGGC